jgi:tRNA A37 threonylcarbamoyltransferase TsaD
MAPGVESSCDKTGVGLVRDPITHLGDTLDDAVAECFDKAARVFGLPYPDGPAIDAVTACAEHGVGTLVVVGGAAANSRVRSPAEEHCLAAGVELRVPPLRLCTDNGAMTAPVGGLLVRAGAAPAPLEYAALHPVVMGKAVAA